MKIAFIGQKGIPAIVGGTEKHVENLAIRLAEMGHEVFVYVRNHYVEKTLKNFEGIKLIHIPSINTKSLDTISYSFLSTLHALFRRYDVIHYQSIGPASLSFIPKFFKRKTAIFATFHYRNYIDNKWGWIAKKYLKFSEWIACKVPDKTVVLKKRLRHYIFSKYQTRAIYIPNGAEAEYDPSIKALERWNLKDKKYLLSVFKTGKEKEMKYLIESFKHLETTNKLANNFKLIIISEENDPRNVEIISGIRENIILTDNQTRSTLQQLFSHAYLFVQPWRSEEFPVYIQEAMGYGTATLVNDHRENLDMIGKCGFSFHGRSQHDLEEKLAYLINKPGELKKIEKGAKERIRKEYSWDSIARRMLRIYESIQKKNNEPILKKLQAEKRFYV
jgi:glycosyltransferase involved in cell wall biosynthesis